MKKENRIKDNFDLLWKSLLKTSFSIDEDWVCQECGLGQDNDENKRFKSMIWSFIETELELLKKKEE